MTTEDKENCRFFMLDNDRMTQFGEFRKELYEPKNSTVKVTPKLLRNWTSDVFLFQNKNRVVVVGNCPLSVNIVDIDQKSVCAERYYDKIVLEENGCGGKSMIANCHAAGYTDQYIFCFIGKRDHKRTKEGRRSPKEWIVLVFDWELNPIKKFYLDVTEMDENFQYMVRFSENCEQIYCLLQGEETLQLMEGKITL